MPKSQEKVRNIIGNIHRCKVCDKEFYRPISQLRAGTCSKKCGYKLRVVKPNSGQFKKGNKPWTTGIKMTEEFKNKLSESRMKSKFRTGKFHPRWKFGSRGYYKSQAHILMNELNLDKKCSDCGAIERIHVHHIDRNYKNNIPSNLIYMCQSCHLKLHHREDKNKCICENCGIEFISGRKKRRFCSYKCQIIVWKSNKEKARFTKRNARLFNKVQ